MAAFLRARLAYIRVNCAFSAFQLAQPFHVDTVAAP
jgi:hypothetical protein